MSKTILVLSNFAPGLYLFRKELLAAMRSRGWRVIVSVPDDPINEYFTRIGCRVITSPLERKGTNPRQELKLLFFYRHLMRKLAPDCVLAYTIKPVVYGGLAARWTRKIFFPNITGLIAEAFAPGIKGCFYRNLYAWGIRHASCVFFQNSDNRDLLLRRGVCRGRSRLLPGSGVNLDEHGYRPYPEDGKIRILFLGRITREKGIRELLAAIDALADRRAQFEFHIAGMVDERELGEAVREFEQRKLLVYHGMLAPPEVSEQIAQCHALILPSYHEGMSNVLLEAAATGRPLLTTDIPGCREAVCHGVTGLLFHPGSAAECERAIRDFSRLSYAERQKMGVGAREKMEREFDRNRIIHDYFNEIEKATSARVK